MSQQKTTYLYVIHSVQVYVPKVKDLLENELLKDDIQKVIDECKLNDGNVQKELKKMCKEHRHDYVEEQTYFSDGLDNRLMSESSLVIDINDSKVIKNRNQKVSDDEMLKIYLDKFKEKISEMRKAMATNEQINNN